MRWTMDCDVILEDDYVKEIILEKWLCEEGLWAGEAMGEDHVQKFPCCSKWFSDVPWS